MWCMGSPIGKNGCVKQVTNDDAYVRCDAGANAACAWFRGSSRDRLFSYDDI